MLSRRKALRGWIEQLPRTEAGELKYGRPMYSGELATELMRDYQKLIQSLAAQVSRSLDGHEILTAITGRPISNAWAFRDAFDGSDTSVVLVTKQLIRRIQSIATGAGTATRACLNSEEHSVDLSKVWGGLPEDSAHAAAFGRLLGHVAITLLMNHEFAHIIIGHQFGGVGCIDEAASLVKPALETYVYHLAPYAIAGPMLAGGYTFDRSQSNELDADCHAILWTKDYMGRFDPSSPSIREASPEDRRVIEHILGDAYASRFVLLASSWALFFALGGDPFDLSRLSEGTHPQVGVRLALMTYAEQHLEVQRNKEASLVPEVARYGALVGRHSFVGITSPEKIFDMIGYKAALENWCAVIKHAEYLATYRYSRDASISRHRIKSALPRVNLRGT